jgi:hypothetical protein
MDGEYVLEAFQDMTRPYALEEMGKEKEFEDASDKRSEHYCARSLPVRARTRYRYLTLGREEISILDSKGNILINGYFG